MAHQDVVQPVANVQDLPGVDFKVGGLAPHSPEGLMDHDAGVRQ